MPSRRNTCRIFSSRDGISCPSSTTSSTSRRSRRGTWSWSPTDFHLPGVIENALILVRERASRRGITLGSTIDERLGLVHGDERKVKQILLNLLSNALKFTPEGGRIDVGGRLDGEVAEVSVSGYRHRHRAGRSGGRVRGVPAGGRRGRGRRKAPGSGWPSPGSSSSSMAARSGCGASSAAARPSRSRSRCGQALLLRAEQVIE